MSCIYVVSELFADLWDVGCLAQVTDIEFNAPSVPISPAIPFSKLKSPKLPTACQVLFECALVWNIK